MPGAGGGSVRTHEINKRLVAEGHHVTVLTTDYPGATARCQDGVQYIPLGFGHGRTKLSRLLGYVLRLPWEVVRRRDTCDLVVEDFFAPFSTMAAPLWSRKPTIAVVQWLHAKDKSRQYRLPFFLVERAGVLTHSRMVAVSNGTAEALRALNQRAHIDVIGNGLDRRAMEVVPRLGRDVVYIGRLEVLCKGLDLLLEAWETAHRDVDGQLVIVGSGPDEELVRRIARNRGLDDRIRFTGWIDGTEKFRLLGNARLVVVPSRHETFGLVAIEALATGTPIVAFDIPCLREVVPASCGWLVEPFHAETLAKEIVLRYNAPKELEKAGRRGRQFAVRFDWDALALQQVAAYRAAVPLSGPAK
ncbi:glycosyltransferase family 4 protein [Kocuria oceani]|uniref:D-inositol 3-phosphate glycosyltransferase n=1 Tax=Kocuria oceani TaxID=988827 RepID=A0ABV9TEC5_9MICC|nr:glycosyltransferase family 4 protein [Kocuria oceani]